MDSKTTKKLIKIVLLVLVISYTLDKLIFFGLNTISDKVMTGQSIGKLNQFLSVKDSVDILVFGNSRANHHVDMNLFGKKSYNMGMDGTGIAYSSTLINTLSKDKEQLVIVHIDTKNFFSKNYNGKDINGLKTKFNRNVYITDVLNKSNQIPFFQNIYYSINYKGKIIGIIKNFIRPGYNFLEYNGYDPLLVRDDQKEIRDLILAQKNTVDCESINEINSIALSYLQSIKDFVENSNKEFIFVTSPTFNDPCEKDNKLLAKTLRELGLTYLDRSNLFANKNDNDLWKDKTHLSKKGAESFSINLKKELQKVIN